MFGFFPGEGDMGKLPVILLPAKPLSSELKPGFGSGMSREHFQAAKEATGNVRPWMGRQDLEDSILDSVQEQTALTLTPNNLS